MTALVYIASVLLMVIGLYAILFKHNLIKIVMGVALLQAGVNLFFVSLGYREGAIAPIYTFAQSTYMTLPMPQAAVLTSIVIGISLTALMLTFAMNYYKHYGTLDSRKGRLKQ